MTIHDMVKMELHTETYVGDFIVKRVPGGWIYIRQYGGRLELPAAVYVPIPKTMGEII